MDRSRCVWIRHDLSLPKDRLSPVLPRGAERAAVVCPVAAWRTPYSKGAHSPDPPERHRGERPSKRDAQRLSNGTKKPIRPRVASGVRAPIGKQNPLKTHPYTTVYVK